MKVDKTEKLDVTKYVGTKTKIEKAQFQTTQYGNCIFLQTEEIALIDGDSLPENSKLTGTLFLPLFENKEGEVYIGEDTKAETFLKAKKFDISTLPDFEANKQVDELIGMDVIVQKNSRGFLEIA